MERRTFIVGLLASPALMALLQACGGSSGQTSDTASDTSSDTAPTSSKETEDSMVPSSTEGASPGVARSDATRVDGSQFDPSQAVAAINGFGATLLEALSDQIEPNLVFSPASIAIALAMTRAGAAGTTASEIDTVFHMSDPDTMPMSMNALTTALESRTETVAVPDGDPVDIELAIANSLWAQHGLAFEAAFLDVLAAQYGAGLELVDYINDTDGARQRINAWVDDATNQRIPELLPSGALTVDSRLTLVNAVYMKAPWLNTFVAGATAPADFTTADGTVVQAPTMRLRTRLAVTEGDGWRAVELPYYNRTLSMLIALADEGSAVDVAALAIPPTAASSKMVEMSLPSFDIETKVRLRDVLAGLGMPTAFDPDRADFSAMTTDEQLFIDAVVHQANITVDEEGTEAAAATAVMMSATSANIDPPVVFDVNRPFVFAIRDNPTGALLFVGRITDPT